MYTFLFERYLLNPLLLFETLPYVQIMVCEFHYNDIYYKHLLFFLLHIATSRLLVAICQWYLVAHSFSLLIPPKFSNIKRLPSLIKIGTGVLPALPPQLLQV